MKLYWILVSALFVAGCQRPQPIDPKSTRIRSQVWPNQGDSYVFAERTRPESGAYRPITGKTGICFSGGGNRALSATIGQLRALTRTGLIENVDYISCVSGGSWASTAFTYYRKGAEDDAQFLGPVVNPGKITLTDLDYLDKYSLGHTATSDFRKLLFDNLSDPDIPDDQGWIRAVGETFFEPFGLYDADQPAYFSLNHETVRDIKKRNPILEGARFHVVRDNGRDAKRPYLVINSCVIWPTDDLKEENLVGFEYTPLYVGSAHNVTLSKKRWFKRREFREVGGGFIEPFAMGSQSPSDRGPIKKFVEVFQPGRPFTLEDASGASSSAFAKAFDRFDADLSPYQYTWAINDRTAGPTRFDAFGDGGNLENFGLISLLRRRLDRIVVFMNTSTKLGTSYDPGTGPIPNPPKAGDVGTNLAQLFGVPILKHGKATHPYPNNRVFSPSQFGSLIRKLQAAKMKGNCAMATTDLTSLRNDWWGIRAGHKVQICWVSLDRVSAWEDQLNSSVRIPIEQGNSENPSGPFKDFPNYKTIGENRWELVQLSPAQVNLLAHLTHWTTANSADIRRILRKP